MGVSGAGGGAGGRQRVAVVGGGPGGLAAALLLRASGVDVTLFERDALLGGRTRTFEAPGGFRFDIGPTFFLYPRVLDEVFAACGERLTDHVPMKRLDPLYKLVFEGAGELEVASDPRRLGEEIAKLAPRDGANVQRFLDDNKWKLDKFKTILEQPFQSLAKYMSWEFLSALPQFRPGITVDQDLKRWFKDPRVRLAFSFQTKYLGMSPFRCPSMFTILSYLEHGHGIWHPIGGCGAVSAAMGRLAERMGVEIRTSTSVDAIAFEGGRAVGVDVGGRRHAADAVVVNGDFCHGIKSLIPEAQRPKWRDTKIEGARLSCSTFMLYLGLEGELPGLAHHTILLARDYERNIKEIEEGVLPMEPSMYVQHAGASDGSMAPPGMTALYVLVPVPNLKAPIDWSAVAGRYRKLALDRLALLGLGDVEARIRYERVLTPADWRDELSVGYGATFNLAHNLGQMLYMRPHNRFAPGVYLVGGGTHPGSGLPVIYEGARISARLVLEDLGLPAVFGTALPEPRPPALGMAGAA